jgi:hypothetical protein
MQEELAVGLHSLDGFMKTVIIDRGNLEPLVSEVLSGKVNMVSDTQLSFQPGFFCGARDAVKMLKNGLDFLYP